MARAQWCAFAQVHVARPPQTSARTFQEKSRIATERCEVKRATFRKEIVRVAVEKLVFLDECGFALNLHRLYGWTIGGRRCSEPVPMNKGGNRSVMGAYSLPTADNPTGLWALWQKVGAWTGLLFEAFIEEAVLPCVPKGSVLVLDNAPIHHNPTLREKVEEAGCFLLYLPPYSPDFNPIEHVWSWIKHQVRTCAPRDDDARKRDIYAAAKALPPKAATGWFRNCGLS
ncbi:MAG: IS630 family transposase [Cytophagaceae bacterium]|nr:MAG: IS630 family transposase [Cytophagaceae bacterium]